MNQNYFNIYRKKTLNELAFKCYLEVGLFLGIVIAFDCQNSPKIVKLPNCLKII